MEWSRTAKVYEPVAVGSIDGSDKLPHDNAVIRAMNSTYNPNPKLKGNALKTVFVSRLHPNVTSSELKDCFSEYGEILSCEVIRDIVTGHSRRYGFVEYAKEHHASRAYRHAHKKILRGVEILVDMEKGRTMPGWKPRSLGGGFGGRRESGQLRFGCRDRPWEKPLTIPGRGNDGQHRRVKDNSPHR